MILGYDPIAGELVVDREDGQPRFAIPVSYLVVKHYGELGILFAEATREGLVVGLLSESEDRPILSPIGPKRWRVSTSPNPDSRDRSQL